MVRPNHWGIVAEWRAQAPGRDQGPGTRDQAGRSRGVGRNCEHEQPPSSQIPRYPVTHSPTASLEGTRHPACTCCRHANQILSGSCRVAAGNGARRKSLCGYGGVPGRERYGLVAQLRKAAVSIPSNVAEGHARRTGHFRHHVNIALGSEAELQTQLELACRLKFVPNAKVQPVLDAASEVGRLLHGLERALEERS